MTADGKRTTLVTDIDWLCEANGAQFASESFSKVTRAEYDRFWRAAALWREPREIKAPAAVLDTVGQGYADYIARPFSTYAVPQKELGAGIFDFGKLYVGYLELECETADVGDVTFLFDYTENPADFDEDSQVAGVIRRFIHQKAAAKREEQDLFAPSPRFPLSEGHSLGQVPPIHRAPAALRDALHAARLV